MSVLVETIAPTGLTQASLRPRGPVHPSPIDWRDQIFYFLLPDRFSDGGENQRPAFDRRHPTAFHVADKQHWVDAGTRFQEGKLRGIRSKLGYLQDLGITALWIGPVWRQRPDLETYHGYGIQNFLEIDRRFGTRQDLRDLIDDAHNRDMYVLLDVIYNHTGNNWFYRNGQPQSEMPYCFPSPYSMSGWRSRTGQHAGTIAGPDDGVWPKEFQDPGWYTQAGRIERWDPLPWEDRLHPDCPWRRGDFYDLKDLNLERQDTLGAVIRVYEYWIALSDCDGFRIDTVKHVPWDASRTFCGAIHEFAEAIGKHNFLLLGEVTGGAGMERDYLDVFGRNIDAVLDIGQPANLLSWMTKGLVRPAAFFDLFKTGHDQIGSHRETGRYHVSILDDHDMVGRLKRRYAAGNTVASRCDQVAHAVGAMLTTLGMPCIYYGTEQAFDGQCQCDVPAGSRNCSDCNHASDRFIRESMFGSAFGAFETQGCHFFDRDHPTYMRIAAIAAVRNQQDSIGLALRRGRQYLRETSLDKEHFADPGAGELTAWSRIQYDREVLVALNPNGAQPRGAWVTVDANLHRPGPKMDLLYDSSWTPAQLRAGTPVTGASTVEAGPNGRSIVRIDLPPAGMCILA